jgi:ABC-type Fe3+ transport system substrate-binding protein
MRAPLPALSTGLVLLLACLAGAARPALARTESEIAMLAGPERQRILEEGARQEGAVTIYSGLTIDAILRPLVEAFARKYPFVKAEYWRSDSRPLIQKALAEQRTSHVIGDVLEGAGLSQPLVDAGILEPFISPALEAIPEEYRDPNHLWAPTRMNYFGTAYNTKLIAAADAPRRYEDLLDPRWRGKIAWVTESQEGKMTFITNLRLAWGEERTEAYLERLAKQDLISFGESARALVNRVMEGEYPLAIGIFMHHALISAKGGAPVEAVPMDPVPSLSGTVVLPKHVPHPYAAMLMIDFLLSRDGQEALAHQDYFPSSREVPPTEYLKRIVPRYNGVPENFLRPEVSEAAAEGTQALYEKYFDR